MHDAAPPQAPEPVVLVRSLRQEPCRERALVLQSVGLRSAVRQHHGEWFLAVPPEEAERASLELRNYDDENEGWPPREEPFVPKTKGTIQALGFCAFLFAFFWLEKADAWGLGWRFAGRTSARRIQDGEWWRTITALTLHGDLGHLISNLFFGAMLGVLLSQVVGAGIGWAAVLAAGALGNAINAAVQRPEHLSVGASTAVFGALGVMTAYVFAVRRRVQMRRGRQLAPLLAGGLLLAWTGFGGGDPESGRVDILAHVFGFLAGLVLGFGLGSFGDLRRIGPKTDRALLVGTIGTVLLAWAVALTRGA